MSTVSTPVSWVPDWSYGNADKFGTGDYIEGLFGVKGQGKQALINRRQNMIDWLDQNKDKLADNNQPGKEGGLYDRITGGNIESRWLRNPLATSGETGGRVKFGTADYLHAIASGKSNQDILDWVDDSANAVQWSTGNAPGGMGLHTTIKDRARMESGEEEFATDLKGLQEAWSDKFGELGEDLTTGLGSVGDKFGDAIREQTKAQSDYQADQASWQRRQEQMQQMMMNEAARQRTQKPVVQVLPQAGGFAGGGGGAAAFARKKKQTTGLNIA